MMGWGEEDKSWRPAPEMQAEGFLFHLAGSQSSFNFVGAGGGSPAASGVFSDNRTRGSLSSSWRTLLAWNEEGRNIEVEGCYGFKAIWMRGHYHILDKSPVWPSMDIGAGFDEVDCYWLVSDSRLPTEQWEAFRKLMHEAFLKLGAAPSATHLSGVVALPGTQRHYADGRSQSVQYIEAHKEPTSYRLQELAEAFGIEIPVIEEREVSSQTSREAPPARGKVAAAIQALDQRLTEGVKKQDKGGEDTPPVFISDLMHDVGIKDRKNFKKDILKHLAFAAALEDRGLEYVAGQWRGKAGYLARQRG